MKKITQSIYFRIAISLVLLALLSTLVDFSEVLSTLAALHPGYVLLIFGLITLDRFFMAFKYNVLLKARGVHAPFWHVLKTYYIGNFMGFFLPATLGVDAVRIWHLAQIGYSVAIVTSAVLIERLLGLVVLSVFSLVATFLFIGYIDVHGPQVLLLNSLALVGVVLIFLISISRRTRHLMIKKLAFLRDNAIFTRLMKGLASYQEYRNHKGALALFSALTMVELFVPVFIIYFVGASLNIHIPFLYYLIVVPIFLFLIRIPFAPSMIGIQEGIFVFLFSFAGITPAQAFTIGLVQHLLTILGMLPGLLFYLQHSPESRAPRDETAPAVSREESPYSFVSPSRSTKDTR